MTYSVNSDILSTDVGILRNSEMSLNRTSLDQTQCSV